MGQLANGQFDGMGTGTFLGIGNQRTIVCQYDFAVQGGAVSEIVIGSLPSGAVVRGGYMIVETAFTGGASCAAGISSEGANDILASAVVSGAPWSTTGKKAIIPKANTPETTSISTTAARNITLTVTVTAITAGKMKLYLEVM